MIKNKVVLMCAFLLALLAACSPTTETDGQVPSVTVEQISPTATPAAESIKPAVADVPEPTGEQTEAAATQPLPEYPMRQGLTYFDFLPGMDDYKEVFFLRYTHWYEAARYPDHYSLRVIYNGIAFPEIQNYMVVTVTVAEDGLLTPDLLNFNVLNLKEIEFPQMGDHSIVLSSLRHFARIIEGNIFIEVALIGGDEAFTPEFAYQVAEDVYASLPDEMPVPADFHLVFPDMTFSEEKRNFYLQDMLLGNFNIDEPNSRRIAFDIYEDTYLQYWLHYPIQEMLLGIYDTEMEEYTFQRYKKSTYAHYRFEPPKERFLHQEFFTVFDLLPNPGFYEYKVWVDQSCVFDVPVELYVREVQ